MKVTLAELKRGQRGIIIDVSSDFIPLKLIEMGCLPGNTVELLQVAPFSDPMYININDSHVAIRKETAQHVIIKITNG
ncbi:ferrous iron transport protein A [Paucihalobacter ruber]|uniref:Ferrous iron transport protein A n=1 Tax=Paucihalobacter ruber TaxID=2567861 RepID=A0A506PMT7_9FLAO|nr:FeoA family protein [Paucihalobacter ruber]TPV35041.1 ferrous iron transport protein A [Paucihalobacter ruber]